VSKTTMDINRQWRIRQEALSRYRSAPSAALLCHAQMSGGFRTAPGDVNSACSGSRPAARGIFHLLLPRSEPCRMAKKQ
jgi:hypothetical protein